MKALYLTLALVFLSACGGGGSSESNTQGGQASATQSSTALAKNQAPVVTAGNDVEVELGQSVVLYGTATDTDGTITKQVWLLGDNTLSNSSNFEYQTTESGSFELEFRATDDDGAISSDSLIVTVYQPANQAPYVFAGGDIEITLEQSVSLTGIATDPDGTITQQWWTYNDDTLANTSSFDYRAVELGTFELVFNAEDELGSVSTDSLHVTVVSPPNNGPIVSAGDDVTVELGQSVTITGEATDEDGSIAQYWWIHGGTELLATTPSFDYTGSEIGSFELEFTAADNEELASSDTMYVTVVAPGNKSPEVYAGQNIQLNLGQSVILTGSASDEEGSVPYHWWTHGKVALASTQSFEYFANNLGIFELTYHAADEQGATSTDTLSINVVSPDNKPPEVYAGSSVVLKLGQSVTLSGSAVDTDGTITQQWWKNGNTTLATASSFVYQASDIGVFELIFGAVDDDGAVSSSSLTVTVLSPDNEAPLVNAGYDVEIQLGESVLLDGSATDADGTIIEYAWKHQQLVLASSPSFEYTPQKVGIFTLIFSATDDDGAVNSDSLNIIVSRPPNKAPIAHAGEDAKLELGKSITLNGTATDADGLITHQWWSQGGVTLATRKSFEYVGTKVGYYEIQYNVADDQGAVSSDSLTIQVVGVANKAPVVDAGSDIQVQLGQQIKLNGIAADSDGTIVHQWWKDGNITLTTRSSIEYIADKVGTFELVFGALDNQGATATDSLILTVQDSPNKLPTVDAGSDVHVTLGQSIRLNGTATDTDGSIVSYRWKQGEQVLATTSSFDYTPSKRGSVTLVFSATDNDGAVSSDSLLVTTSPATNKVPVVNAGSDVHVTLGQSIRLNGTATDTDGSIVSYRWKQGEQVLATTSSFDYTPSKRGSVTLVFSAADNDGAVSSDSLLVTTSPAKNKAPEVDAGEDVEIELGQSVVLFGEAKDSDGSITKYSWRDGDKELASTQKFEYTPSELGTFTLSLFATDNENSESSDTVNIHVKQPSPKLNGEFNVENIQITGDPESTYNLVIVAEAFRADQRDTFHLAAKAAIDAMKRDSTYASVIPKMNVYAVHTPSVDGEISLRSVNPSQFDPIKTPVPKDTFFDIYFQNSYRAYQFEQSTTLKARSVAAEHIPFVDNVLVVINGTQGQFVSGRADGTVAYAGVSQRYFTSGYEKYVLIHELGHSIAGLADTYSSMPGESFNKSVNNDPNTIRWKNLLSPPEVDVYKLFDNVYGPSEQCIMKKLQVEETYFCPVCAHEIHRNIETTKDNRLHNVHRVQLVSGDTDADGTAVFKWDEVKGATGYEISFNTSVDDKGEIVRTWITQLTNTERAEFTLPVASSANIFGENYIRIRAFNHNYSTHFQYIRVRRGRSSAYHYEMSAPDNIQVAYGSDKSALVTWDSNQRSKGSTIRIRNNDGAFSEIVTDKRRLKLHNLKPGAVYTVQIAATHSNSEDDQGSSRFSEEVEIIVPR